MNEKSIGQNIIKHQIRYDLEIIANLIKPDSSVLDIGCGDGELLAYLRDTKNTEGRGLEISQTQINRAIKKGISVIQGDAQNDLSYYLDNQFDYAILSQTIQATHNPKEILQEMMRIAKFAIISLPNFAHYKNRLHLLFKGTMPKNKTLPYEWYDTPNIHFCTIRDFENLCFDLQFGIKRSIFLTHKNMIPRHFSSKIITNLFAEYGIFLISKNELCPTAQEEFCFGKSEKILQKNQQSVLALNKK